MSTQNKEPNFPYCNLTIITPVKTVRDMNMKCPLFWKIETLKKFIRQYHEDFFDYFKQNSWCLILAGKTLEEEETVENIIKKNKIENFSKIIFFMQFHPNSKIKKGPHEELYEKEKAAKSHLLESLLLLDFRSKLLLLPSSSRPSVTTSNLKDPLLLTTLPLMSPYFTERTKELKASFDEQKNPFRKEEDMDVNLLKSLIFDAERSEFRSFKYTLMARMAVILIFFCILFRNPAYVIVTIIALQIYYTITIKNELRKIEKIEKDRLDAFLKSKSSNSHPSSLPPPSASSASPPPPLVLSKSKSTSISFFSRFYEMIVCFVSSLYPTWDLDTYIEDHKREEEREREREGMRKEERWIEKKGEKMQEKSRKEGEEERRGGSVNRNEEQDGSEEGRREGGEEEEKKERERREKREEEGRSKEEEEKGRRIEEDFDPTDNINPQNFGLIEKMRLLHELRERINDEEQNSVASAPEEGEERREEEVKRREEEEKGKSLSYGDFDEMSEE